jgi:hypothetical protein
MGALAAHRQAAAAAAAADRAGVQRRDARLGQLPLAWQLPGPLDLAERDKAVYVWLMNGGMLATGVLFWLLIIASPPLRVQATPAVQAMALLATNFVMFAIAIAMTLFTHSPWYSAYEHVPGVTLSPLGDQHLGAGILWGCGDSLGRARADHHSAPVDQRGSRERGRRTRTDPGPGAGQPAAGRRSLGLSRPAVGETLRGTGTAVGCTDASGETAGSRSSQAFPSFRGAELDVHVHRLPVRPRAQARNQGRWR